jgi:hypothetical protein
MRTELRRIDAIKQIDGGGLRVLKRNVSGLEDHDRLITALAQVLYPAAMTLAHNADPERVGEPWVQRWAATKFVRDDDVNRLRRISSDRLIEFTESIDDLFVAYETLYEKDKHSPASQTVGIGVFYFEEDKSETDIFG